MPPPRQSATAAHVAPFVVFLALNVIPGWLRIANPELPWYRQAPEQWVYPLQTLLCGGLLLAFRRQYQFPPWRGYGIALALALLGFLLWVAPAWLGWVDRTKGFDPTIFAAWPEWQAAAVGMRFVRLVVIVPLVEELFWRGFLMRYIAAENRPWTTIPFGLHRWQVFWIVTILVMLAHHPADYAAAFAWGALVYFVAVRTKSLGACVLMHAACNLLLGLYVMRTQQWGFW